MEERYILNGYKFSDEKTYNDAVNEKRGIKYLLDQIDLNDYEKVKKLYCDLCEQEIFRTPVGLDFMRKLRSSLLKNSESDELLPYISVPSETKDDSVKFNKFTERKLNDTVKETKAANKKIRSRLKLSVFVNILLIVAVIVMFIVAYSSSHPNIINYERTIQDKYAKWSEDLKEKENELRQRENALK